jgi:hypothetical protein
MQSSVLVMTLCGCAEGSGVTVHGEDGLGGARPPLEDADLVFGDETASEFIYKTCKKASGQITLVSLGPLTNLALSLRTTRRDSLCPLVCPSSLYHAASHA